MTDTAGAQAAQAEPTTPTPAPAAPAVAPAAPPAPAAEPSKVDELPKWAQDLVHSTREEAAAARIQAKNAADTAVAELKAGFAKALGLEAEQLTPEQLAEQARATATAAQTQAVTAQRELAIYKAAQAAGANADALLDSNTFLAKVSQLDPTAADFGAQVSQAITAAVAANPTLKVTQAAAVGGAEITGGPGEQRTFSLSQISDFTYYQAHKAEIEAALKAGRVTS